MKTTFKTIVMSCLLIAGITSMAQARYIDLKTNDSIFVRDSDTSSGYYSSGTGSRGLHVENNHSSGYYNISTGTLNMDVRHESSPASDPASWHNFQAYCIEKDQYIQFGTNPTDTQGWHYDVTDLSTYGGINSSEVEFLGKLWANAFDISKTGKVQAGAFQALVWEARYDDTMDLDAGNFDLYHNNNFTSDVLDLANDWINNINNKIWTRSTDLFVLTDSRSQDFITAVPEPASMSLCLIGGVMLLGRRRRQRIA